MRTSRSRLLWALIAVTLGPAAQAEPASPDVPASCGDGRMNLQQAISDQAQSTTIAFSGLALITGNLEAQTFFPPGKLADYWGFQYLRDNDPDAMGHNTSFLTRVACNVLWVLEGDQVDRLRTLAAAQVEQINEYGLRRYTLMKAFRRLLAGDLPAGSTGLDRAAVTSYSADLYRLDGLISYDRAVAYAEIFRTLTADQRAYLDAMAGKGWKSWPDRTTQDVREKTAGLPNDAVVAMMTYAGDMFSWYAGCVAADVYFCPERHGTYYGGFYIKDAPAIGHEGYGIDETLTATAGSALCDSSKGYVTPEQAALVSDLVELQRNNLYAGASNIVQARTDIATALRSLVTPAAPSSDSLALVKAAVLEASAAYGELDGDNNYVYASAFARLDAGLTRDQASRLAQLRRSILSGTYSDGTPFDFSVCTTYYLFSAPISDTSILGPYVSNTDFLFDVRGVSVSFAFTPAAPTEATPVTFVATASGGVEPYAFTWVFEHGTESGSSVTARLPRGDNDVTVEVRDAAGAVASATGTVAVGASARRHLSRP